MVNVNRLATCAHFLYVYNVHIIIMCDCALKVYGSSIGRSLSSFVFLLSFARRRRQWLVSSGYGNENRGWLNCVFAVRANENAVTGFILSTGFSHWAFIHSHTSYRHFMKMKFISIKCKYSNILFSPIIHVISKNVFAYVNTHIVYNVIIAI